MINNQSQIGQKLRVVDTTLITLKCNSILEKFTATQRLANVCNFGIQATGKGKPHFEQKAIQTVHKSCLFILNGVYLLYTSMWVWYRIFSIIHTHTWTHKYIHIYPQYENIEFQSNIPLHYFVILRYDTSG